MRKHILTYLLVALVASLSSCGDSPKEPQADDSFEMSFRAYTAPMSRTGVYESDIYPVGSLDLTAYYQDPVDEGEYYFTDKTLTDDGTGKWTATNWYWPLTGKMSFLGFYCEKSGITHEYDKLLNSDGTKSARMTLDTHGLLDGKTDLLYLAPAPVACPQRENFALAYYHGLAWITVTISAAVLNDNGTLNDAKTDELIGHIKLAKITIEDCSRNGNASIVPGSEIIWSIPEVKDQIYYRTAEQTTLDNASLLSWHEIKDASTIEPTGYIPLTKDKVTLSKFTASSGLTGEGLLIIPQQTTAITIDYKIATSSDEIHKFKRFELRDNTDSWRPGFHYNYDIVFSNYSEIGENITLVPSWESIQYDADSPFGSVAKGSFTLQYSSSLSGNVQMVEAFEIHHEGSSVLGDEMDYIDGGKVF